MLCIRIKKIITETEYFLTDIKINILENTIIGFSGKNAKAFILTLTGENKIDGDIVLDTISINEEYSEYIKNIQYISDKRRKRIYSDSIIVNEYLDLGSIMKMNYENLDQHNLRKLEFLRFFHIEQYENVVLKNLQEEQYLLIEFIAAFLRNPRLILIDEFFSLTSNKIQKEMCSFLQKYITDYKICILVSKDIDLLTSLASRVYLFDNKTMKEHIFP